MKSTSYTLLILLSCLVGTFFGCATAIDLSSGIDTAGLPQNKKVSELTTEQQSTFATLFAERLSPLYFEAAFQSQYCMVMGTKDIYRESVRPADSCGLAVTRCERQMAELAGETSRLRLPREVFTCEVEVSKMLTCVEFLGDLLNVINEAPTMGCGLSKSDVAPTWTALTAETPISTMCGEVSRICPSFKGIINPDNQLEVTDPVSEIAAGGRGDNGEMDLDPTGPSGQVQPTGGSSDTNAANSESTGNDLESTTPAPDTNQGNGPSDENGCALANNGICDEPHYCDRGTDTADCATPTDSAGGQNDCRGILVCQTQCYPAGTYAESVLACRNRCSNDLECELSCRSCEKQCFDQASPLAQQNYEALWHCGLTTTACDDKWATPGLESCLAQMCGPIYSQCGPFPAGYML